MHGKIRHFLASGEALILTATIVAAIGWVASKEVINGMASTTFIGWRFVLAALALLPWCWGDIRRLSLATIWQAFALGSVLSAAILFWIYALRISPTMGEGAFIMTTAVLLSPLVGWGLFRTPPPKAFWLTLPIAVIGIACLSLTDGWHPAVGQLLFLVSAFLLSLHFNLNKYFSGKIRVLSLVCLQLFSAGGLSLMISLFQRPDDKQMSIATWGWFATSVLLCTSLRYVLQTKGQHRISTSNAALMMILEPIWVLLLGILMYQESLPLQKIVGCALIIVALLLYRRQL